MQPRWWILPVLTAACLSLASRARPLSAEPPAAPSTTPAAAAAAEIEAAKAAHDDGKWVEALKKVGSLYSDASDADKKTLAHAASGGLKAKSEAVQQASLEALVATKDGEGAWRAGLKEGLPDEKTEKPSDVSLRALDSLKDLHPEGAVPVLLGLVQKAKDAKVSAHAFKALGGYERSKQRAAILDELMKVIHNSIPSRGGSGKASAPTPRWTEIQAETVPALNGLTGQTITSLDDWLKFHDENKKDPKKLFKNPL